MPSTLAATDLAFNHDLQALVFIQQNFPVLLLVCLVFCSSRVPLFLAKLDWEFSPEALNRETVLRPHPHTTVRKERRRSQSTARPVEGPGTQSHVVPQRVRWKQVPEQPAYLGFTGSRAPARCSSDELQNLKPPVKCQRRRRAWGGAVRGPCARSVLRDGWTLNKQGPCRLSACDADSQQSSPQKSVNFKVLERKSRQ